jgi:hypothetical protein
MINRPRMILRPKNNIITLPYVGNVPIQYILVGIFTGVILLMLIYFQKSEIPIEIDSSSIKSATKESKPAPVGVVRLHSAEVLVPAASFSGILKKPLEIVEKDIVSCPERGGKNTQCGKVSSEYRFKVAKSGDYYLYVQVIAPGLNDNSLWIGVSEDDGIDFTTYYDNDQACQTPSEVGSLIPHKHLTSSGKKFLCCPAYLAKNKKKGLAGFYSDCCYMGLGKDSTEKGCVLDLEVDSNQRWNELPRVIRTTKDNQIVSVRIYAREDGTSWSGVVLSNQPALDAEGLDKLRRSKA